MEKDCCKEERIREKSDGKLLEYVLLGMVAVIFVTVLYQSVQISALKNTIAQSMSAGAGIAAGQSGSSGAINMAGWTDDEKMMYEHHGTLPARLQGKGQNQAPSTGMVGGC